MINLREEERLQLENLQLKFELLKIEFNKMQMRYDEEVSKICTRLERPVEEIESIDYVSGKIKFKE